jgi:hypothetical protein
MEEEEEEEIMYLRNHVQGACEIRNQQNMGYKYNK